MGLFGCLLGRSWALLGALGALIGRSWALLGALEALFGRAWGALGARLGALRRSGVALGRSWALLGASWAPLGHPLDGPGRLLGASWASWAPLGRLLGAFWASWAPLGHTLGDLGSILEGFREGVGGVWMGSGPQNDCFFSCSKQTFRATPNAGHRATNFRASAFQLQRCNRPSMPAAHPILLASELPNYWPPSGLGGMREA